MKCDHLLGRKFDGEVYILASDVMEAINELKQKLENVQASMYADVVDANMKNCRLQRALWLLRSAFANRESDLLEEHNNPKMCWWADFANKCLKKAEEYK